MNHDIHPVKTNGHADYERRDIGIPAVYYFLVGLAASLLVASFAVSGLYHVSGESFSSQSGTGEPTGRERARRHPSPAAGVHNRF